VNSSVLSLDLNVPKVLVVLAFTESLLQIVGAATGEISSRTDLSATADHGCQ